MPILIQDYARNALPTVNHGDIVSDIVQAILRSRLGKDYSCQQRHTVMPCSLMLTQCSSFTSVWATSNFKLDISIAQQGPCMSLLERWTVSYTMTDSQTLAGANPSLLLQAVLSSLSVLPVRTLISRQMLHEDNLTFGLTFSTGVHQVNKCSPLSSQIPDDFRSKDNLSSHHFPSVRMQDSGYLHVEVVYEELQLMDTHTETPSMTLDNESDFHVTESCHPHSMMTPAHPLQQTHTGAPTKPISVPLVSMRRLSRLSLSAMEQQSEDGQIRDHDMSPTLVIPIPSPKMQYTHHGYTGMRTVAFATTPSASELSKSATHSTSGLVVPIVQPRRNSLGFHSDLKCLVGSYEESLLSGRMSTMPSKPITFQAQIGVLGQGTCKPSLKCPPHLVVVFPASFYDLQDDDLPTPFVGTVDLLDRAPGYRLPHKGQLQIMIKNPNKTCVKLYLIPYDVTDMPPGTKTFVRQKSYAESAAPSKKPALRYAIHVQLCKTDRKRVYLYKHIRVVFANRISDLNENFIVVCEGPKEPVYTPLTAADLELIQSAKNK